jgi:hypothetical protein
MRCRKNHFDATRGDVSDDSARSVQSSYAAADKLRRHPPDDKIRPYHRPVWLNPNARPFQTMRQKPTQARRSVRSGPTPVSSPKPRGEFLSRARFPSHPARFQQINNWFRIAASDAEDTTISARKTSPESLGAGIASVSCHLPITSRRHPRVRWVAPPHTDAMPALVRTWSLRRESTSKALHPDARTAVRLTESACPDAQTGRSASSINCVAGARHRHPISFTNCH